jgi:hypothetical protein
MRGAAGSFRNFAEGKSALAWFVDHDLDAMRRWSYLAAKTTRFIAQYPSSGDKIFRDHKIQFLLNGHKALIEWLERHRIFANRVDYTNPRKGDFWMYIHYMALQGRLDVVADMAHQGLTSEPKSGMQKRGEPDYLFFQALGRGDTAAMTEAILAFTRGSLYRKRNNHQSGLTADLFCASAVLYTKMAWKNGFEIDIQSEHIPMEWMPFVELPDYPEPVQFLRDFDIHEPLPEGTFVAGA